tara:strand:- start:2589 stop:3518 length:930 start_codon:yes stop_codon:yes gene_type:complete
MKLQDFLNEAKQVKAKDPKPKKIKPNKGHESPHPMRGKLVGEAKPQKPKPYSPKQPNPVAKHSRNKSGAGAHKSAKDYDRKDKRADILSRMDEGEERSIIQQACIQKLIDNFSGRESNYENKEDLEYAIFQQLEQLDVADCVDPEMEVGGQPIGNFASGKVLDTINASDVIYDVMNALDLSELYEGSLVASRGDIINSILEQLRKEAYDDIGLIKHLAKLIGKTVQVRRHKHKKEGGVLQLEMKNEIPFNLCPKCGDSIFHESEGKKDACYHKVKSRYKVWPSAYASGALVQCRKKGAKNWGNKSKKKK